MNLSNATILIEGNKYEPMVLVSNCLAYTESLRQELFNLYVIIFLLVVVLLVYIVKFKK